MRLFLDANILFTAAHNPKGKSALILELGQEGLWQLVTSAYAPEEARRNIAIKFPACAPQLETLSQTLRIIPDNHGLDCPDGLVDKDCPIYRAALASKADVLLTGDIHDFGFLMNDRAKAEGIVIQTVAEFLNSA